MPRKRRLTPEYRYHISGQARVYLDGRYYYLGKCDSPESLAKYRRLVAKYLSNDCTMPDDEPTIQAELVITVGHVAAEFLRLIDQNPTMKRWEHLCTLLEDEYGDLAAFEFAPVKLSAIRDLFVASGNARPTVNTYTARIVMMFEHAVSRELINENVLIRLRSLKPMRANQTSAPEYKERKPVDIEIVRSTAEHLSPQARGIIILQVATGMRPSEIFNMRPADIDRSGEEWFYRPTHHKTKHHGKVKAVPIVDAAREALASFLCRPDHKYCFSPAESAQWFRDQRSLRRKTPMCWFSRKWKSAGSVKRELAVNIQDARKFTSP
jgi:integrase